MYICNHLKIFKVKQKKFSYYFENNFMSIMDKD